MKIIIGDACTGFGVCEGIRPDVFEVNDEGFAEATDEGLTAGEMTKLGLSLRSIRGDDLHFLSVPHGGPTTTSGGASVVATDEEAMDVLREALRTDDMGTYYAQYAGVY